MPSTVFYSTLNDLCRKYLIGSQPLTPKEIAESGPAGRKMESEVFENLAIFDRIDFKVFGENVPLAVLIRLFGVDGFERLIDQDAIRFTLWTPMIAHMVDTIDGIEPLAFGRHNSTVHCDPEESIAEGIRRMNPALKPGDSRSIRRKVRDLYSLPNNQIADDAVKRGARVNAISPGIIITPLANDELTGPRGAGYRRMMNLCPAGRAGTPDEVGNVGALLMGPDGAFITGSDFLMDGGVTASYFYGELAPQ